MKRLETVPSASASSEGYIVSQVAIIDVIAMPLIHVCDSDISWTLFCIG